MAVSLIPLDNGTPIKIDKTIILIGRHPDCDIVLTNSRKISRKHCCLAQIDNRLVIRDLGSMNGVWVNGQRVRRQNDLSIGDEVSVGDVSFRLASDQTAKRRNGRQSKRKKATAPPDEAARAERPDLSQDVPIPIQEDDVVDASDSSDSLFSEVLADDEDDSDDSIIPLVD